MAGTGVFYRAPDHALLETRLNAADKPGKHLWVFASAWLVQDPKLLGDEVIFDQENLLTLQGPGCYKCEKPYSGQMAKRKCLGTLKLQPE